MTRTEFVRKVAEAGGRVYIVGGWVRDYIRKVEPKDCDYTVTGINEVGFVLKFPEAQKVGRSFPVFLLEIDGTKCEVAFARKDWKSGMGYHGFKFLADSSITIEEDLSRRDTTMNAMALDLMEPDGWKLIDPFNGQEDIKNKTIRAINEHFCDDPTRALRAARQAAQFGYTIHPTTTEVMVKCCDELALEPTERIFKEMEKALDTWKPSVFFRSLPLPLLKVAFPELYSLVGVSQPSQYHPEGDAFEHTMMVIDYVTKEIRRDMQIEGIETIYGHMNPAKACFCALMHDIGKGVTPKEILPHHYEHERRGLDVLEAMDKRMTLPKEWKEAARFVIKYHMKVHVTKKSGSIVKCLMALDKAPITPREFSIICKADCLAHEVPKWLYYEYPYELIKRLKHRVTGDDAPKDLKGPQVGEWLHARRSHLFHSMYRDLVKYGRAGLSAYAPFKD